MPPFLHTHELALTKIVKGFFHRGRIEFRIDIETNSNASSDRLFSEAHKYLANLSHTHSMPAPTLADVFSMQQRLSSKVDPDVDFEWLEQDIRTCCENLRQSRLEEGARLEPVVVSYIDTIERSITAIKQYSEKNPEELFEKLTERFQQQTSRLGIEPISDERLASELILYVDKSDISEEIQRVESHIKGVRLLIENGPTELGKKLDFYMQEFFREANTIGSKTNSAKIIDEVVTMKVTIEKIREQAANIE